LVSVTQPVALAADAKAIAARAGLFTNADNKDFLIAVRAQ